MRPARCLFRFHEQSFVRDGENERSHPSVIAQENPPSLLATRPLAWQRWWESSMAIRRNGFVLSTSTHPIRVRWRRLRFREVGC